MISTEIPKGVKFIGRQVFCGCSGLRRLRIPEGVRRIGEEAFLGCASLRDLYLPSGVRFIGDRAFRDCDHLEKSGSPKVSGKAGKSLRI